MRVCARAQVTLTTLQLTQYETVNGVATTNGRFVADGLPGAEAVFTPSFDNHTFEYHVKAWPVGAVNFSWTTVRQQLSLPGCRAKAKVRVRVKVWVRVKVSAPSTFPGPR